MSVNIDYLPAREVGNGAKVAFTFTFKVFNAADLVVGKILKSTNIETAMVLNTDYTVVINTVTEGGTVTYTVAPTTLQDSFIRRLVAITQEADIPTNNLFREVQIENALDKTAMISQQQQIVIERSLRLPETSTGVSTVLPVAVAKKVLVWNAAGTAIVNSTDDYDDRAAAAAASAAAAAVSAAAAVIDAAAADADAAAALISKNEAAASAASIAIPLPDTSLQQITTAGKVGGAALTGLASIPSGGGVIPAANLTSVAQKGANSDITSITGLTTALTTAQGGTGVAVPAGEGVWAEYSATSTIVGWSSFITKQIYTKKIGKTVFVAFDLSGTSNSTAVTFTVPYTSANPSLTIRGACFFADNGVNSTVSTYVSIGQNSSTIIGYKNWNGAVWTASGGKTIAGTLIYESA